MTKRAVLYARINDHDECKLAEQLQTCREYAQSRGWQVVAELADQGISGVADKAPQLKQAIGMAWAGEFDVLIVREMDRLSRDLAMLLVVREEFRRSGVQVECILGECDGNDLEEEAAEPARQAIVYARESDHHESKPGPDLIEQRQILWEHAYGCGRSAIESDPSR
jgi:predicted site-specific integrase-resolvase